MSFWAGAGAGLLSGVGGFLMNDANRAAARDQMEFQRNMSDTAHQREVRDLRKAGLNPILSATGGSGASTGQGAMPKIENALGAGVNSAIEARRLKKELDATDSQIALNQSTAIAQGAAAVKDASTARNVELNSSALKYQLPALQKHGEYDSQMAPMDAILRRVGDVLGNVNSAKQITRPIPKTVPKPNSPNKFTPLPRL